MNCNSEAGGKVSRSAILNVVLLTVRKNLAHPKEK